MLPGWMFSGESLEIFHVWENDFPYRCKSRYKLEKGCEEVMFNKYCISKAALNLERVVYHVVAYAVVKIM